MQNCKIEKKLSFTAHHFYMYCYDCYETVFDWNMIYFWLNIVSVVFLWVFFFGFFFAFGIRKDV